MFVENDVEIIMFERFAKELASLLCIPPETIKNFRSKSSP